MAAVAPSDRLVSAVLSAFAARAGIPVGASAETFARQWLHDADASELAGRASDEIGDILLRHWELLARRMPGEALVRVFEPDGVEGEGCPHSVIQIVTDDMPFLVDSVTMELNRRGLAPQLLVHPVPCVGRDAEGRLVSCREHDACAAPARLESAMYIEIERIGDEAELDALRADLLRVLADVRAAVE